MAFTWPEGFPRIPDEPWTEAPVQELAVGYDTVEQHGWYDNLDPTVEDLARSLEAGDVLVDYSGGTGILVERLLDRLTERAFGVVIVDASKKFLRLALEKFREEPRVAFRCLPYLKEQRRVMTMQEVLEPPLLERGVDVLVSTNAIHLYYGLADTLASWHDLLRSEGRVFIQSGNIGLPEDPGDAWIIDETVGAIAQTAREIVREDDHYAAYRGVLDHGERMDAYRALREKFFLAVRPLSHYVQALEEAGFEIHEITHRDITARVDDWYEFLSVYHEGVLGWVGGSERVEGQQPSEQAVEDRKRLMREAMDRVFQGKQTFQAVWTYIDCRPS